MYVITNLRKSVKLYFNNNIGSRGMHIESKHAHFTTRHVSTYNFFLLLYHIITTRKINSRYVHRPSYLFERDVIRFLTTQT